LRQMYYLHPVENIGFRHNIIQKITWGITREITRSFTWEPGYIGAARIENRGAKELAASRINP